MGKLLGILTVVVLCDIACEAKPAAVDITAVKSDLRNKRTASKAQELKEQLAKLRDLLNDYDKSAPAKDAAPKPPKPTESDKQKSKSGESTLSKEDKILLQGLKSIIHNSDDQPDKAQILEKVVYRLLSDLDLAFRNGISVKHLIKYLYEKERAAREEQIEKEETQLKALLNKVPAPRD